MYGFLIFIHALVCVALAIIILMQSGRGGGLTEAMAGAENMFGAKTSSFLVKGTTILGSLFLVTCLSLAFLSVKRNESIMAGKGITQPLKETTMTLPIETPADVVPSEAAVTQPVEVQVPEVPAQ